MTKVTVEKVFDKKISTKRGERLSVGLKIKEDSIVDINGDTVSVKDRWINGFFEPDFKIPFEEGEQVELLIKTNGEYLNFSIPGVGRAPAPDTSKLVERIQKLEEAVFGTQKEVPAEDPDDY